MIRRVATVALCAVALATAACAKGTDASRPAVPQGYRLAFAEDGRLLPESRTALDAVLADAAKATDVFIFSHGWWNSPATAECRYAQMIDGVSARARARRLDGFRAVLVGIYWPSAIFPPTRGDCDEGSGDMPEALAPSTFRDRIREWAAVAFPMAAARATFATEAARATELLGREREGAQLSASEVDDLVRIFVGWRDAGAGRATPPEIGEGLFEGDASTLIERWRTPAPALRGEASREGGGARRWVEWANVFTFWVMKDRAGVVGSRGVFDVVRRLQPYRVSGLRIHLIGHSFGGKLVTAAIAGDEHASANTVDSLVLLQAAFSHFALSTAEQIRTLGVSTPRPGAYASVLVDRRVEGPIVVTFSGRDRANQFWYPRGVAVTNDFLERAAVSKFGALGADGLQGPAVDTIVLGRESLDGRIGGNGRWHVNIDGSAVILGHSDLAKPEVFDLIWNAALAARQWPRPTR